MIRFSIKHTFKKELKFNSALFFYFSIGFSIGFSIFMVIVLDNCTDKKMQQTIIIKKEL